MNWTEYNTDFVDLLSKIDAAEVEAMISALNEAWENDHMVFIFGNGGSGATASHICEDLGKGTLHDFENQKRMKALSLTDNTPYILAWGNDEGFDRVFIEQLKNFGEKDALVIAISGSGNSANVLRAVEYANENGMKTFGMTGFDGGKLKGMVDQFLHVPSNNMGAVESVHLVVFHHILDELYARAKAKANA